MKNLKLAIIGAGHLGRIHARLAAELPGVQLVGVADPVLEARTAVAAQAGTRAFADYRELIGQIDAAIVATPTSTHHEVGMELLSHGIHLLIEKPLALNASLAEELVEMAQQNGVILQVGHVERFNPALERVMPQLVDPKYIEAVRTSAYPFRSTDIGVVLDLMIHDLDVALALAKSTVTHVDALGVSVLGGHEDIANARLHFENGCVATLTASRASYQSQRTMNVWSPQGFTAIDFALRNTTSVYPGEELMRGDWELATLTPQQKNHYQKHMFEGLLVKQSTNGAEGNAILNEQRDLVDAIVNGHEPRVTGEQAYQTLLVAEQILHSIETHAWDGHNKGRLGPFASPETPILRATHWDDEAPAAKPLRHREAG
jgi:predicted dehydrogenase